MFFWSLHMEPVIPTLHSGTSELLEDKQDIIAYIVRFALTNPGRTSSYVENDLVSFRKLEAKYGTDRSALASAFSSRLNTVINNYYPDQGLSIEVSASEASTTKYKLTISISDDDGQLILDKGIVSVNDDSLIVNF